MRQARLRWAFQADLARRMRRETSLTRGGPVRGSEDEVVGAVVRWIAADEGERASIRCLNVEMEDAVTRGEVGEAVASHARSAGAAAAVVFAIGVVGIAVFEIRNAGGKGDGGARHADVDAVGGIAGEQDGIGKTPGDIALTGQRHGLREGLGMKGGEGAARDFAHTDNVGLCGVRLGARGDAIGDGSQPQRHIADAEGLALGFASLRASLRPPFVGASAGDEIGDIETIHRRCGGGVRDAIHRSRAHDEGDAAVVFEIADVPGVDAGGDVWQVQASGFITIAIQIDREIVASGKGGGG